MALGREAANRFAWKAHAFGPRDTARALSEENVEKLRRAYEAFSRGDFDVAIEIAHPEIEFLRAGNQSAVRGAVAFRAWMEPDALEDMRMEPLEFRIHGNKVLVHQRTQARGAESGIELELIAWAVWTLDENGLATRLEGFQDHERNEALEAAGLSE
jgi:ketosteroid isomerase-like protein